MKSFNNYLKLAVLESEKERALVNRKFISVIYVSPTHDSTQDVKFQHHPFGVSCILAEVKLCVCTYRHTDNSKT